MLEAVVPCVQSLKTDSGMAFSAFVIAFFTASKLSKHNLSLLFSTHGTRKVTGSQSWQKKRVRAEEVLANSIVAMYVNTYLYSLSISEEVSHKGRVVVVLKPVD